MKFFQGNAQIKLLEDQISELEKENEHLRGTLEVLFLENKNLKTNISSLFATAKKEIERKDVTITTLRTELEDLKFRRVGKRKYHNLENDKPHKMIKIDENDIKKETCSNNDINEK